MRVRRVELTDPAMCDVCGDVKRLVVLVTDCIIGEPYAFCVRCARRIGVAAVGGRWGKS